MQRAAELALYIFPLAAPSRVQCCAYARSPRFGSQLAHQLPVVLGSARFAVVPCADNGVVAVERSSARGEAAEESCDARGQGLVDRYDECSDFFLMYVPGSDGVRLRVADAFRGMFLEGSRLGWRGRSWI